MKNTQFFLLSLFSTGLFLQTPTSASPLVSIGDNADVFFNGSSSLRWQSNIFRDEVNEVDDLLWVFSPGFELNVGRGLSSADLSIITRYDFLRYIDQGQLDTEEFHITALGSYSSSRLDLSGSVSFDEEQASTGEVNFGGNLITYEKFATRLDAEYRLSPKFSVGSGFSYSDKQYTSYEAFFSDEQRWSIPVNVYYELTPKVDLSAGYSHTEADVEAAPIFITSTSYTRKDDFFNIGARGQLLPKLSGSFRVGYRTTDSGQVGASDDGMLGLDANLSWSVTPKLTTNLLLSRDFGTGGQGESTEETSIDLTGSYSISSYFAASANLGYTNRDYTVSGRDDDQFDLGARLSYTPNQYWTFSTGYTYSENDSSTATLSYENHIINFTASLRY